ncbi:MAG: hypothetical protein OEW99_00035 [Gammaproteobacteria bacterium]|nr:hypothetical protein [Gammaproteobacteria bacterium]
MSKKFFIVLKCILLSGIFVSSASYAEAPSVIPEKIYSGFYSREGNNDKMAQTTGNNTYVKFYPKNRIIRLYIPYPYAKTVTAEAINKAFDSAVKKSSGSAYIRDKFGAMDKPVVAHLDSFRWVDNQVMYDCGKSSPCKVIFDEKSMTVFKPGMVVEHKINYVLVK